MSAPGGGGLTGRTSWRRIGAGLLFGAVAMPALLGSTAIALRLRAAGYAVPSEPVIGKLWWPVDAVWWWRDWGHEYAGLFWQGLAWSYAPLLVIGLALAFRVYQANYGMRPGAPEPDQDLGTAGDLLGGPDVRTAGPGVVIGKYRDAVLRITDHGHVLVTGPSGSGKGVGVVIPTLLEHDGSILVHDPKNSLTKICGRHRSRLGPTWAFNPTSLDADRFNPLELVRGGDFLHGDCETIGTLIATSSAGESADPVWEEAAGEMLTALLLVAFERGTPTLAAVHDLMFEVCAQRYPKSGNDFVRRVCEAHAADHHKITSSVNFTMRARMKFMSDPVVRHVTGATDFSAGDLFCGSQPSTIFITVPPADRQRMQALMRVTLQMMMTTGLYLPTHVADGRRKTRDVLLLFDEFPTLRRMDFLQTNIAECREYGIRVLLVAQDLDQIQAAYGRNQSITANCHTVLVMPGFSQSSLDTLLDWGGTTLKRHRSRGREILRPLSLRTSETEMREPLLNPQDMIVHGARHVLIFRRGHLPTYLETVRYYEEPRWRGLYDRSRYDAI